MEIFKCVEHPHYFDYESRLKSFKNWSTQINVKKLSKAGFDSPILQTKIA